MPGTLLFIDLDRFEVVNDTRGHAAGDMLLAQVAQRLRAAAEATATIHGLQPPLVGRLAGDEFTIFLPSLPEAASNLVASDVLTTVAARDRIDADLRSAIDAEEFALVFQPQVATRSGAVVAAEALLRWRHPTDGFKHAGSFIARAEDICLIVEIGRWEVAELARTVAHWDASG